MLQIRSILDVADNSGAKRAAAIGVIGRNQRYAMVGDIIKAHIKEASPDGTVKKGEVVDAGIVRTRKAIRRSDSSYMRFDTNAIVIIDKENNPARLAFWSSPASCGKRNS
jgi:large subunit ribosomal protein L14